MCNMLSQGNNQKKEKTLTPCLYAPNQISLLPP